MAVGRSSGRVKVSEAVLMNLLRNLGLITASAKPLEFDAPSGISNATLHSRAVNSDIFLINE